MKNSQLQDPPRHHSAQWLQTLPILRLALSLTPSATQGHSPPSLRDSETVFDDLVCPFAVTLLRNRSFCPEMPPRLWLTWRSPIWLQFSHPAGGKGLVIPCLHHLRLHLASHSHKVTITILVVEWRSTATQIYHLEFLHRQTHMWGFSMRYLSHLLNQSDSRHPRKLLRGAKLR